MSSYGTAASRASEKDGKQQLHLLVNPDGAKAVLEEERHHAEAAAAAAAAGAVAPTSASMGGPHTMEEVARVERLLAQLEARSMALVPYGYGSLREVGTRKSNNGIVAAVLVGIWLSTIVLVVAYLKYSNHSPLGSDRVLVTSPAVIAADADPQEKKVAESVDTLAKALVTSSQRLNELQAQMEKNNRDLQKVSVAKVSVPAGASKPAAKAQESPAPPAANVEPALPKNWHKVVDVKPTENALAHKGADGTIDYWLVPRAGEPTPSKVLPIGTSPDGVVVHSLEDGKDYTLTPSGEWRSGAMTPQGN